MKNFFSFYYISTNTCHESYSLKHYVKKGKTEAAVQKCSLKIAVLKMFGTFKGTTLWNVSKYGPEKTLYLGTFHAVNTVLLSNFRQISEQLRFYEVIFKRKAFPLCFQGEILITTICLFWIYLEWANAILRTTLQQNTRELLLLEVTATKNKKWNVRVKLSILTLQGKKRRSFGYANFMFPKSVEKAVKRQFFVTVAKMKCK